MLEMFSQSPIALQELKNLVQLKLHFPWHSLFAAFNRIFIDCDGIQTVSENNGWLKFNESG